jgi:hypothetical protein
MYSPSRRTDSCRALKRGGGILGCAGCHEGAIANPQGDTRRHLIRTDSSHCQVQGKLGRTSELTIQQVNNTQVEIVVRLLARS